MFKLTNRGRIDNYEREMGVKDSLWLCGEQLVGMWVMGNSYGSKSKYYGAYPGNFLRRLRALYPDHAERGTLHLFSGMVDLDVFPGDTVDHDPYLWPTHVDDAETLTNTPLDDYRLILCDPPYSIEDAVHYHAPMVNRNKVMKALEGTLPGTHVVWLDQVLPMYAKRNWNVVGRIGISLSTNHRFRVISIFERKSDSGTAGAWEGM